MKNHYILVTGATGSLGGMVVKKLLARGESVRCLVRKNSRVLDFGDKIDIVVGSLEDEASLKRACKNVKAVIHCAGVTHTNDASLYYRVNYRGTKNLMKAAPSDIQKFIYISSTCAVGEEVGPYGYSKTLAEEALMQSPLPYVIIRPSEVYGATKAGMIEKLIKVVQKYPLIPLVGRGNFLMAPVHANDVVSAIVKSLYIDKKRVSYTIAGPDILPYREMLKQIQALKAPQKNITMFSVPLWVYRIAAVLAGVVQKNPPLYKDQIPRFTAQKDFDIQKAREDLNFEPRGLEEGLKIL